MALCGNQDGKTASGTIAIASNGAVTGSSTTFTTQARVGDYIVVAGEHYQIVSIASNTSAQVRAGIAGATLTAVTSGTSYALTEKPAFVTTESAGSASGVHGDITKVFGMDTTEMQVEKASGAATPAHAGWVRRTVGTDGRAGRVFYETLVAGGSITGDLEDVVLQDLLIVIGTQPANDESATGDAVTFTVAATTVPSGGTIGYQWQISEDAGATWANVSNTGVYSTATTATLNISDNTGLDGNQYRVKLDATGATTVYSTEVTLTEAA
jgi:hypothetical protein